MHGQCSSQNGAPRMARQTGSVFSKVILCSNMQHNEVKWALVLYWDSVYKGSRCVSSQLKKHIVNDKPLQLTHTLYTLRLKGIYSVFQEMCWKSSKFRKMQYKLTAFRITSLVAGVLIWSKKTPGTVVKKVTLFIVIINEGIKLFIWRTSISLFDITVQLN